MMKYDKKKWKYRDKLGYIYLRGINQKRSKEREDHSFVVPSRGQILMFKMYFAN
jgi:hypothetical protein